MPEQRETATADLPALDDDLVRASREPDAEVRILGAGAREDAFFRARPDLRAVDDDPRRTVATQLEVGALVALDREFGLPSLEHASSGNRALSQGEITDHDVVVAPQEFAGIIPKPVDGDAWRAGPSRCPWTRKRACPSVRGASPGGARFVTRSRQARPNREWERAGRHPRLARSSVGERDLGPTESRDDRAAHGDHQRDGRIRRTCRARPASPGRLDRECHCLPKVGRDSQIFDHSLLAPTRRIDDRQIDAGQSSEAIGRNLVDIPERRERHARVG
ncbi:MAG: hypothetical protein EPO26_10295 [Chloroflexota bacterium]|nr:MAG: hypothetical protein EPO26_10295 [Chloroflexota bacterium]